MNFKKFVLLCLIGIAAMGTTTAQKIGYINLEVVLSLMPEMQKVNTELQTFQGKLQEQLKVKQDYAGAKYQEFLELTQSSSPDTARIAVLQQDLQKLQSEIQNDTRASEQRLLVKRQELMDPIIEKLQGEVDKMAQEEGYDLIINAMDGSGVSIVLFAPDDRNLTKPLLDRMGIQLPEEGAADGGR